MKSELTNTVPLSPCRSPRASRISAAYTSTLKPSGTFILATGSLSAGVGTGNAGTGAICAPGPVFGRPMAQNGGSSSFCCASAGSARSVSIRQAAASVSILDDRAMTTPPWATTGETTSTEPSVRGMTSWPRTLARTAAARKDPRAPAGLGNPERAEAARGGERQRIGGDQHAADQHRKARVDRGGERARDEAAEREQV